MTWSSSTSSSSSSSSSSQSRLNLISKHLDTSSHHSALELNTPFPQQAHSTLSSNDNSTAAAADTTSNMSSQPSHPALLIPGPIEFDDEVLQSMSHFRCVAFFSSTALLLGSFLSLPFFLAPSFHCLPSTTFLPLLFFHYLLIHHLPSTTFLHHAGSFLVSPPSPPTISRTID
jgi:hypothetical protein